MVVKIYICCFFSEYILKAAYIVVIRIKDNSELDIHSIQALNLNKHVNINVIGCFRCVPIIHISLIQRYIYNNFYTTPTLLFLCTYDKYIYIHQKGVIYFSMPLIEHFKLSFLKFEIAFQRAGIILF